MPGFDERLKQHLERLAPPADPSGAFGRVLERKIRRRLMRRFQAAGLAVAVVVATIGGTFALVRVFESRDDSDRIGGISPTPGPVANGRIAYVRQPPGSSHIWTVNPDGTSEVNITDDALAPALAPSWSPDGARIAFVSERDGFPAIYVVDADGTNAVRVKRIEFANHGLAWSPDGARIAYISSGDLFVMNADGSQARRVTSGPKRLDFHPTWAPDGSRIAFARYTFSEPLSDDPFIGQEPAGSGIYVINLDDSGITKLTDRPTNPAGAGKTRQTLHEWPDWSPDGKKILFQHDTDIYVMDVDGSDLTKLTDNEEGNSPSARPSWSPDGNKIVFERTPAGESSPAIFTMNADGTDLMAIGVTGTQDAQLAPDWQPLPAGEPTSSPTAGPTPTTSPFPPECDASQVTGNFDGDDQPDTATVARTQCLLNPDELGSRATEFALRVQWPPSEGIAPLPGCKKACQAVAATDLNLDGTDEFILKIDEAASTGFFQVYELPPTEAFGRPADVVEPGAEGFPGGKPAVLPLGGSETHYAALGCWPGNNETIAQIAELNAERTEYSVHSTKLRFDPIDAPPFGQFTVISTSDYKEEFDTEVGPGDRFEPGGPCWM